MALKLVPFSDAWIGHDKIDLHAIYRRPRFVEDKYGEMEREYKDGIPTWDLTGPLPVRLHNRWRSKGFEYVTLASREALNVAARFGTLPPGTKAADFDQHQTGGPWNYKRYAEGQESAITAEADQLRRDVEEFGSNAVLKIRQSIEPEFKLPADLADILPQAVREMQAQAQAKAPKASEKKDDK
jgi:hypothetical protein